MYTADELPLQIPPEGVNIAGLPLTLLKVLGRGGQGLVYLAYRPTMDRQEVVKFPEISPDAPHAVEDFRREIHALSRLKCESIVTIYIVDVLQTGRLVGRPYFTMEHVEGGSLKKRLHGDPLPVRQALTLAIEIAEALSAAHAAGIVHRDIKPQNVLLTRDGKAKLIDFGLARLINESKKHTAGFIRGTPKYISPEAARAEVVGPQGDLYSLGALLFEMLTGRPPFEGNEYDLMLHHATTPAPALREIGRGGPFPVELEGVMRSLLAKQIHERPQSAGELRRVLEGIRRLVPDEASSFGADVDAQDPTVSAAAATVHRNFPVAIASTRENGPAPQRTYRSDDVTVDAPGHGQRHVDATTDESIGRTGVVARDATTENSIREDVASTKNEKSPPHAVARAPRRHNAFLLVALAALFGGAAVATAFFVLSPRQGEIPQTPSATPAPSVPASAAAAAATPTPAVVPTNAPSVVVPVAPVPSTAAVPQAATNATKGPATSKSAAITAKSAASASTAAPTPTSAPTPPPTKSPIDDRF